MEKSKLYPQAYFPAEKIEHILNKVIPAQKNNEPLSFYYLTRGDESWRFNNEQEYFAEYRKDHDNSFLKRSYDRLTFKIRYAKNNYTDISVEADSSKDIDRIFEVFEKLYPASKQLPTPAMPPVFTNHEPQKTTLP
ncbi:hypothetical protein HB364_20425 [Pseudoflavitalea sp. X16]|uniref:hypothetical protein n=1 Tax=Paraflavitalea devenefica TaxID=2716334 RepID=UPI001423C8D4|nr:hypothetical protein [Paraflavitalea devenefica]NII27466.1 hypothetical protein [Paraflavitalea devenefica]